MSWLNVLTLGADFSEFFSGVSSAFSGRSFQGKVQDHTDTKSTSLMMEQSRQASTLKAYKKRRAQQDKCSMKYISESLRAFGLSLCSSPLGCSFFLPYLQPTRYPLSSIKITDKQSEHIRQIRNKATIQFNRDDESHVSQLYSFGVAVFGESFTTAELFRSPKWKTIGFQGMDPTTDFRAAGVFALQNLFYLVSIEPRIIKRMIQMQHVAPEYYLPFAITCINLTYTLLTVLHLNCPWNSQLSEDEQSVYLGFCNLLENEEFAFEEIYKSALQCFDEMWVDTRAKYYQFPEIMLRVREKVCDALMKRPDNVHEFNRYMSIDEDEDVIRLV